MECPKCLTDNSSADYYKEEGRIVETVYTCNKCDRRIATLSYGEWDINYEGLEVTILPPQRDALYSYIKELEMLVLSSCRVPLPSNREDVDWDIFETEE